MAEGSFERLPKWAQDKIINMQRAMDEKDSTIKELTGQTPVDEAHVLVSSSDVNTDLPLPHHTEVRFVLTPKTDKRRAETLNALVMTDRQGFRSLRVLGDRPISIQPVSTNGMEIRLL